MKLNNLVKTNQKTKKRVGRGIGSGKGKTSGRGMDGQKSRSGGKVRIGFEGGQTPLAKRLPKLKGFRSIHVKDQIVNVKSLNVFSGRVTKEDLYRAGLIKDKNKLVKILGKGKLDKKVDVEVDKVSKSAENIISKVGGKIVLLKKK